MVKLLNSQMIHFSDMPTIALLLHCRNGIYIHIAVCYFSFFLLCLKHECIYKTID